MKIQRAEHSGFCAGVKIAVSLAEQTATENPDRNIYTLGELVHNKDVIGHLAKQGIQVIQSLEEAEPGSLVIIRAHGVPEAIYLEAEKKEITLIDATCKYVRKIQILVKKAYENGQNIVIIGDRDHPEVIGINGHCNHSAAIFNSPAEVKEFKMDNICMVAQTTIKEETWEDIRNVIKQSPIQRIEEHKTICSATTARQESCRNLSQQVDAMIVIGDKTSSNSCKLYKIASDNCKFSHFIERKEDLPLKEVAKYNRIGIAAGASTPECTIKEVIATMSEQFENTENMDTAVEKNEMLDLMEEIEKSLRLPNRGEVVDGTVVQVTNKEVVVNIGCKKDGILPKDEVSLEEGKTLTDMFQTGGAVQAKVIKTDDGDGNLLLSTKKLAVGEHWDEISEAVDSREFLEAKVVKEVKGGVIAVYKEVSGFIPMSQLSDRFVEKADEFIGKTLPVRVTRVDQKRNKAVFSHKEYLMEEKNKKIAEIWSSLNVGDVIEGKVMRFTDYGAFVDIGGLDGLLHISEISWGKLKHPQEALKIGETIKVKVLGMNAEKNKISLGMKQNTPEPWENIDNKYNVGDVVDGKIVQIKEYGAFVELEPGLDGLVHISEIAHKRVTNIADEVEIGQVVKTKILEIDKEKKRINLSIKETLDPAAIYDDSKAETTAPVEEAPVDENGPEYLPTEETDGDIDRPEGAEYEEAPTAPEATPEAEEIRREEAENVANDEPVEDIKYE